MTAQLDPDTLHSSAGARVHPRFLHLSIALFLGSSLLPGQCATCHSKIAASFAKTGMARSFYKPATIQPVRFYHQLSETWFAIEERGGSYYQRRWRVGYDAKDIEVQESRIDYVMGSGNHVRTYLHRTDRGSLIELPLAWYAENGGEWAMNPGHDRDYALPPRAVAYECMFCHNAYPKIPAGHDEPGGEPLGNFLIFFDHAAGSPYRDDFEIAHSAYRLRKSRCFLASKGASSGASKGASSGASKGAMTCATCHDPHDVPRGAEAALHYNGVCGQCHRS